jgi:thiosulfate/3-mercaptopyruvate sulfurtransferase
MTGDTVVSIDWLAANRDEVRVVDVRDAWEFEGIGHVPGAVNVPFDRFRSREGEAGMLPGADRWAELLSEAGIDRDDRLVAYDDERGVFAARFLVTAHVYGHADWHLLDGDFSAWSRSHETTNEPTAVSPTTYEASAPASSPLVGFEAVRDALETDAVVVDTRDPEEYAAGHLPGAVQLDWRELVDPETRGPKPRGELESLLADRGITPDRRIVLYCNTARRISHTYVLLRHLGYETVDFYEGSLTEWRERDGPLEEGAPESGDAEGA